MTISYSTSDLQTRLVRYKCCLASTGYSVYKAEQYRSDNLNCLQTKFDYLTQGIDTIERHITKLKPYRIFFDFTELEDSTYPITRTFQFYTNDQKLFETIFTASSYSNFLSQVYNFFVDNLDILGLIPILEDNILYLYSGCSNINTSEILLIEGINSYWDLSDLPDTFTAAYSFTIVNTDDSSTIVDFPIQSYTSKNQLITSIINQINLQGDFFAYSFGDLVYVQSLDNPGISVELTLNLTNPFSIQVSPTFDPAPVTYELQSTTLDSGNCSVYNPNDDTYWFIGQNSAGGGNIVICITQSDGTNIKSTEDADYQAPFTYSRGIYDPNTKRIYITAVWEVFSGKSGIVVLDADNLNVTYGEIIDFWLPDGENAVSL